MTLKSSRIYYFDKLFDQQTNQFNFNYSKK